MKRLRIAGIGCGNRTSTYMSLASKMPDRYRIVGAADPIDWKVARVASEGVGTFHQAHSFVRGHWGIAEKSSPMIIQSCHDLDIIQWMIDRPFLSVSSFGDLTFLNRQNMPDGAPPRCIDGCPVGDRCQYNAMRYLTDQRAWLGYVYNGGELPLQESCV